MSESEYTRLDKKLDTVTEIVLRTDTKLADYPDIRDKVLAHDKAIETIVSNCKQIQSAKKSKSVPWGNVKGAIIGGLVVGIIMLAINVIIALAK